MAPSSIHLAVAPCAIYYTAVETAFILQHMVGWLDGWTDIQVIIVLC